MSIKFGAGPIEFEKGKAGIVVPSRDKLPAVIDTLISAVRVGELDELFSQPRPDRSRRPARLLDNQYRATSDLVARLPFKPSSSRSSLLKLVAKADRV
jgi:hypothetical protein